MMVRSAFVLSLLGAFLTSEAKLTKNKDAKYVPGSYVVEFEAAHDPTEFFDLVNSMADTRMSYDHSLFKGASIQFHDAGNAENAASKLMELQAVKNMWPNRIYSLPKDKVVWTGKTSAAKTEAIEKRATNTTDTFTPHVMTQVDKLRAKGYVGNGIKVGVIDSGVDYTHPALGGCFGPGCLVAFGADIVGDDYTGYNTPVPDADPYSGCNGHGTHVSGIIAAQAKGNEFDFTGAAPGVTLGMYRVFGCDGSAGNDVLIDAYLQAFEAGSNIITASIGGASGWSEDPWAVVVSRIVDAGVPCTVSAGNDGDYGLFYASTASNGKRVSSIGSIDNWVTPELYINSYYSIDGGEEQTFGYAIGDANNWANVTLPLWAPSYDTTDPAMGCDPYPEDTPDLSEKIVLIRRGTCTFVQKVDNAAAFGAKYVMFYRIFQLLDNVSPGAIGPSITTIEGVGMVDAAQGESWTEALAAGSEVILDMLDPKTAPNTLSIEENPVTGGYMSTYSTWNPTFEMDVKPQVSSPGGNILSTWPQTLGSYAVISGTSMACPLVAGIYALIAEVRGTFDPATLENLVAATAKPQFYNDGASTYGVLAPVAQMGAGIVQAYDAAFATTLLSKSYLAYNDTDNLVDTLNFTVTNLGKEEVTYVVKSVGAASAYTFSTSIYPDYFPGLELSDEYAAVKLSETEVTLAAGDSATIEVTVTPPAIDGSRLPVYSGYITLNGTNGENLSIPYNGAVGSLHDTKVLDIGYLADSADENLAPIEGSDSKFVLSKDVNTEVDSYPVAVAALAFGSPLVHYKLLKTTGWGNQTMTRSLGDILDSPFEYASRNPNPMLFDGRLADGSFVPAGKYQFKIEALHIFGNASDPTEYDVSTTEAFTISYA
ncbi:peptidase S8/S53 domain-containing protein [Xylariaceae sp. FL1019]|nr:peptidase S8/S53 domain-containing protein [Xylariaceae sp. FL1019]